jgi:hypothetical protein
MGCHGCDHYWCIVTGFFDRVRHFLRECYGCHHYKSLSSEFFDGVSWLPWLPVIDGVSIVSGFF